MSQNSNENLSSFDANADLSQSSITTTASIASSSPATSLQSLSLAASIDELKNEKLKIIFDNPDHTYYSGQTIRGTITLNCKQKKKIRGKSKWMESIVCFLCVRACQFVQVKKNISTIFVWVSKYMG